MIVLEKDSIASIIRVSIILVSLGCHFRRWIFSSLLQVFYILFSLPCPLPHSFQLVFGFTHFYTYVCMDTATPLPMNFTYHRWPLATNITQQNKRYVCMRSQASYSVCFLTNIKDQMNCFIFSVYGFMPTLPYVLLGIKSKLYDCTSRKTSSIKMV